MRYALLASTILLAAACEEEVQLDNSGAHTAQTEPAGELETPAAERTADQMGEESVSEDALSEESQIEAPQGEADGAAVRADSEDFAQANVPENEPAFENQTRAPLPAETEEWTTEVAVTGLSRPWAFEFLPQGGMIVTEKDGALRIVNEAGEISEPVTGIPEVDSRDQGGLLDVALAPDFESSRMIYLSYAQPREGETNGTAVARGTLSEDMSALENVEVIFEQQPGWNSTKHFGSRLIFAPDGTLYVTLGERSNPEPRQLAQDPTNHIGSIVRINADGSVPEDNPFAGSEEGADEIWAYGTRNIQAAALDERGQLWEIEHGPQGGDELNMIEAGKNYGWPVIGYGENYGGDSLHEATAQEGMEQPVYYWDPVIAPSGMIFYDGAAFPAWQGDIFVGGLASLKVVRLDMEKGEVVGEEWLPMDGRIRDVQQGPDGAIYALDESNGEIVRIAPADEAPAGEPAEDAAPAETQD